MPIDIPSRDSPAATAAPRTASRASRTRLAAGPPDPPVEKNNDRRTMAAKSATVAPAMVSRPTSLSAAPESLSTGTTSPSDVADSVTASSSGDRTTPAAPATSPTASPRAMVRR